MSRLSVINLAELPPMQVIETIDTEAIMRARMGRFKELWASYDPPLGVQYDVENLEFDPIRINQECCTLFELMERDRVNQAARDVTLAFGWGGNLDGIASRYPSGVPRLPVVSEPRPFEQFPQDWESDDRYRQRIWLAPNLFSPHGTAEAYEFFALTADATMHDARATSDEGIRRVRATGIRDRPIAPRSPWQNGYAERLIGSIRRDCLDHVVVFGERHLRHLLGSYQKYYNDARTHLSLNKDAPASRAVQAVGRIVPTPHLGGLHHQYVRI
jgi:hypothetical protein